MKRIAVLMMMLGACHSGSGGGHGSRPAFDDKLLVPAAKGLTVGAATLADVTKAFPGAEVKKDKSLGGEGVVQVDDKPGIMVMGDGVLAELVDGKLVRLDVSDTGLLPWLVKTMDPMPGSKDCPGNRKMGKSGEGEAAYCASARDGVVFIDSNKGSERDTLSYHLVK